MSRFDNTNSENLNQYTIPGIYTFANLLSSTTTAPSGAVLGDAHALIVAPFLSAASQILIDTEAEGGHIFVRYQSNLAWRTLK